MKYLLSVVCFLFLSFLNVRAQPKLPELDKSPMDISYFPDRYPILKIQGKTTDPPIARVIYSRPQKKDRVIFGGLLDYGKLWRMGANEATEIEFFTEVTIAGTKVKKGRYTLYGIPYEDKWTIILNKDTDTWGSFKYDKNNDLLRTDIVVHKLTETVEEFVIVFEKSNTGANLLVAWENIKLILPIVF